MSSHRFISTLHYFLYMLPQGEGSIRIWDICFCSFQLGRKAGGAVPFTDENERMDLLWALRCLLVHFITIVHITCSFDGVSLKDLSDICVNLLRKAAENNSKLYFMGRWRIHRIITPSNCHQIKSTTRLTWLWDQYKDRWLKCYHINILVMDIFYG